MEIKFFYQTLHPPEVRLEMAEFVSSHSASLEG